MKSNIDGLTNVYNKMYTENESASYLNAHSETSKNAMLIIDIDNFKDINDTLGHISGDNFLRLFGKILNELIAPPNICGRIGGDEFLILLKNIDNLKYAEKKASEIMAKINEDIFLEVNKKITCSIGIAFVSNKFVSFFELYQLSDTALYRAKKLGRNRFVSYKAVATIKDNDKKLMLIADDSSINRIVLKQTFKNEYNIVEASDGEETLGVINQYSGKISVILLDIRMPKINGFEILEYLRTKPDLSRIPTLVVTSDATLEEKCLELGSSDIIIKPIEPNIAKLRVKNAVNNWKPS